MNYNILTFAGLIGIGVVVGATLDTLNKSDSTSDAKQAIEAQTASNSASNPFTPVAEKEKTDKLQQLEYTILDLQSQVQTEIEKRKQLEQKLVALEKEFASNNRTTDADNTSSNQTLTSTTANPHRPATFNQNTNWFNEQALVDAGIDQTKVSYIKEVFEQAEMDRLYLRDQAAREGWMGSKRYNDAAKEIADRSNALRSELNDKEYDAYLYAAGRSNRVIVESVLSNSPASNAGIQAGDVILTYDNQRIYSWTDLTGATSKGAANSTVAVTIVRNDQQQQVYLPRGPLGVRLTTDSVAP